MMQYALYALIAGYVLDQIIGDPMNWPHIVRFYGLVISWLEKKLYPMKNKTLAGSILVICELIICTGIPAALLALAWHISPYVYFVLETILVWQCLAARSLAKESGKVYTALRDEGLDAGRKAVSMIVGRDTENLTEEGVVKAAVETVAENTSDGVAAPIFYMALFGAVGGCFYKAVNTMDSMIGYKNDRYLHFGTAAAKLDDVLNFIPSRLCAISMIIASSVSGMNAKNAWKIFKRDRYNHASPNSAQTESVMAGALGIRLAGDAYYFGKLHKKPYIGDALRDVEREDILRSHRLLNSTAFFLLMLAVIFREVVYGAI